MCEVPDRVEARGIEKGRLEGTINTLISLVKDGILSLDEAATRAGMSAKNLEKYIN